VDAHDHASLKSDSRSDLELIAAINGGDPAAFESLYFSYRDWVVALAFRLMRDETAALDVMQETFLYVLKKFPGFQLTSQFKTFLYPAVRNLAIGARNKAQRYQATDAEIAQIENTPAEDSTTDANVLKEMLRNLPEEQREVLLLRFVDGLDLAEIAGAMEIPLGTVKSRLHNALKTLRGDPKTKLYFE
jgi:RNA polymerase sigma-70 factor (ECF subfamily)